MSASLAARPERDPDALGRSALIVASAAGVFTLLLAGITLFALGIAFPIALHVAQITNIAVSAADLATATRFAGFAWAFIAASAVVFAAAVWLAVATARRIPPTA